MKTQRLIFVIFACVSLLMSCSEFDVTDNYPDKVQLKKASAVPVFIVEPGGGDDTPAIMQAFVDAKAAGPGSVVQLVEGEYHLGFLEIRDFYGSFRGAGKDKTIITVMNNLDAQAILDQNMYHALVKFVGGDILVSDFTLRTPEGPLTVTGFPTHHIMCLMNFSAYNAQYEMGNESRSINAVVDNVSFNGQYYEDGMGFYKYTYNCMYGLRTGFDVRSAVDLPRENINFKITNCDFNTFCYGLVLEGMKDSELVVGKKNNGNVLNNCEQGGGIWESRAMKILVEGNTFNVPELCWGFDVSDVSYYPILKEEPETKLSTCNIQFNIYNLKHSEYALLIRNQRHLYFPGEAPTAFQVRNNKFNMTDYSYDWGLAGRFATGMVIRNNQFTGLGQLGMYFDYYASDGLILGNNFSSVELEWGSVYLNSTTSNWSVVGGGDNLSLVLNYGVNNIITGVNVSTSETPLGRTIADKLPPMNQLMH